MAQIWMQILFKVAQFWMTFNNLEGKLEGLLLTMLVKQRYLNDSDETIEASYTFPAGWGANLMGFSVELNGKRMQAVALAKKKAEKKYEEAIESGDTPVMLEKSPLGLYTANLGNLKPGEEAVWLMNQHF